MQLDVYTPTKDIIVWGFNAHNKLKSKYRSQMVRRNIHQLSPAINVSGWSFQFVEERGESLKEIDDQKFLNDVSYAAECLKFTAAMQLPKEDANPAVVKSAGVFNSERIPLSEFEDNLDKQAAAIFKKLKVNRRILREICNLFHNNLSMRTASTILTDDPSYDPQYCNRSRWCFQNAAAKLGTITNWLGDRTTINDTQLSLLMEKLRITSFKLKGNQFTLDEQMFLYELILIVQHAFDTVRYLKTILQCHKVIDVTHVGWVYHENEGNAGSLKGIQQDVNHFSYTVLLPLFFTKELYVHRSRMLAECRQKLVEHRLNERRLLSGDVVTDSRRMRQIDSLVANEIRQVASVVCVSDLASKEEHNMVRKYGTFPQFLPGEVCGLPSSRISIHFSKRVHYKVDHLLKNIGNRVYRTQLEKRLKPVSNDIILAGGDVLVTHPLVKTMVVYTNDPIWGVDIIGAVEQPIYGNLQCIRHKLLAYIALIHMLSVDVEEEHRMQNYLLENCYSKDNKQLKELVMEFLHRKIVDRKNSDGERQDIRTSEVEAAARWTVLGNVDKAIVEREMIHYLITSKTKLVPQVPTTESAQNDGCYYKILYTASTHGNGKLLINMGLPLAGLSTTQANYKQLYTKDDRVLTSSVDLRTKSPHIVHLIEKGDSSGRRSFPVPIVGDLYVA